MKQIGDHVRLHYRLEYGAPPLLGDLLVTATGRLYLIRGIHRGRTRFRVDCVVVGPDVVTGGSRYSLVWDKRGRRR